MHVARTADGPVRHDARRSYVSHVNAADAGHLLVGALAANHHSCMQCSLESNPQRISSDSARAYGSSSNCAAAAVWQRTWRGGTLHGIDLHHGPLRHCQHPHCHHRPRARCKIDCPRDEVTVCSCSHNPVMSDACTPPIPFMASHQLRCG